jgi:two-component system sensor histidine kinase UhpB
LSAARASTWSARATSIQKALWFVRVPRAVRRSAAGAGRRFGRLGLDRIVVIPPAPSWRTSSFAAPPEAEGFPGPPSPCQGPGANARVGLSPPVRAARPAPIMSAADATAVPISSGNPPEAARRPAAPGPARRDRPLDLPRFVMRGALLVAGAFLLLSLGLGLVAAGGDTRAEVAAALALARVEQRLAALPADDAGALEALRALGTLRHVRLRVADAQGHALFDTAPPAPGPVLRWLLQRTLPDVGMGQTVSWSLPRPGDTLWTATLTADPQSEQREGLANLLGSFGLLAACSVLMLAVMRWHVRRAFRPLRSLLDAIAAIEHQDLAGVQALPPMPVRELEATSAALKQLAASLEQAEHGRRLLAHKVLTLQEDERQRIARDLHDEFGQRLTALRADAAWLQRRLAGMAAPADAAVVLASLGTRVGEIQRDVRGMLARLQPLGAEAEGAETAARLEMLLQALVAGWSRDGVDGPRFEARVRADEPLEGVALPRPLVLALYRISQEAFTNAARHADARCACIEVEIHAGAPGERVVAWCAGDDGHGLAHPESALQRGNGLAGMQERVWALGGAFAWSPAGAPPLVGLALRARLRCAAGTEERGVEAAP